MKFKVAWQVPWIQDFMMNIWQIYIYRIAFRPCIFPVGKIRPKLHKGTLPSSSTLSKQAVLAIPAVPTLLLGPRQVLGILEETHQSSQGWQLRMLQFSQYLTELEQSRQVLWKDNMPLLSFNWQMEQFLNMLSPLAFEWGKQERRAI